MKDTQIVLGISFFTLAIVAGRLAIGASEFSKADTIKEVTDDPFAEYADASLRLSLQRSEGLTYGVVTQSPTEDASASDLNQQFTNPVSTLWYLSNQFNNFKLSNGHWNNNWNFQPVIPVSLTKDWNLITRPVMPFYNIVPHQTAFGEFERAAGLGDLILLENLSPAHSGHWLVGAGPTFILPTANSDFTGQGKWQAGPSMAVGYLTKNFILGVFPQQWWSIGGEHTRPHTSQLNLQPFASIFFGDGWNIGYSGNILANWRAPSENVWTVPIGLGVGKVVKLGRLPVKIQLSLQYMPVHPRISGQEWNVQVLIAPVIPKLIKGALFD
jgi:hypothetical protein